MKSLHFFTISFIIIFSLFLIQGCSIRDDENGDYIGSAYASNNVDIAKENVTIYLYNDINKSKYVVDYDIVTRKNGQQIPLMIVFTSENKNATYSIKITLNGKNQQVLHADSSILKSNFSQKTINDWHNFYSFYTYSYNYIDANLTQGKHKIHIEFISNSGKTYDTDCSNTKKYAYSLLSLKSQNRMKEPIIKIIPESNLVQYKIKVKKNKSIQDDDIVILVNKIDNYFLYVMRKTHFLISFLFALLLINYHKKYLKKSETPINFYIINPISISVFTFTLWGIFGCLGMKIIFFPFALILISALYVGMISSSFKRGILVFLGLIGVFLGLILLMRIF